MRLSNLFVAVCVPFLAFSFLSLFFGESGFLKMQKIQARNRILLDNLEDLDSKKQELTAVFSNLRGDPESLVISARALGLYRENDQVILFQDSSRIQSISNAGRVLRLETLPAGNVFLLRVVSISLGILVFIVGLVSHWTKNDYQENP